MKPEPDAAQRAVAPAGSFRLAGDVALAVLARLTFREANRETGSDTNTKVCR